MNLETPKSPTWSTPQSVTDGRTDGRPAGQKLPFVIVIGDLKVAITFLTTFCGP